MEGVSNKLVNSARVAHTIKQPLDQPAEWGGRECDGNEVKKERNERFNFNLMHVEFRGGEKDFLLLFSFEFLILESD